MKLPRYINIYNWGPGFGGCKRQIRRHTAQSKGAVVVGGDGMRAGVFRGDAMRRIILTSLPARGVVCVGIDLCGVGWGGGNEFSVN